MTEKEIISTRDKEILRGLAKKQLEEATTPQMDALRQEWYRNNACEAGRPMVTVELATFADDIIPSRLTCEGESARSLEAMFLRNIVNYTLFHDDTVINPYLSVGIPTTYKPFGIDVQIEHLENSVGHHFTELIKDLEDDFHILKPALISADRKSGERYKEELSDLFGDILPIEFRGSSLCSVLTQDLVHIMSMETMLFSMYDYPELFHRLMQMNAEDTCRYYRFLEQEGLILPTTESEWVGQGSMAFTHELPGWDEAAKRSLTTKDVWGFMDSQETSGISPEQYEEFIFPYYQMVSQNYGMFSYGCCEAVHPIWESCLSKLKNLRRLSISPWCDEKYMGERLAGTKIVYHRKPSPNFLGVGSRLDEDALRAHIKTTIDCAKGCAIEFTQRDVYQLGAGEQGHEKVARYVEIIREESEKAK